MNPSASSSTGESESAGEPADSEARTVPPSGGSEEASTGSTSSRVPTMKEHQTKGSSDVTESREHDHEDTCRDAADIPGENPDSHQELDPRLFELSEEETKAALNVKAAIEGLPDLDCLSDFMYVNLAMAGDLEWAVARAYKMQDVRREYDIKFTYEDGAKSISDLVDLLPGFWMFYSFNLQEGTSIMVMDMAKFQQSLWRDPKIMARMIRGIFYLTAASHPCFEVIRQGKVDIFEFEGFQLKTIDLSTATHITSCSVGAFPTRNISKGYHTPMIANVFISSLRKLIPNAVAAKYEVGCTFAGGRLDQFYMQPTPEVATRRVVANLCCALKIRMTSEKCFSLPAE